MFLVDVNKESVKVWKERDGQARWTGAANFQKSDFLHVPFVLNRTHSMGDPDLIFL